MLKIYLTNFFNFLVIMYTATIVIYFYLINIYFGVNCLLINMFKFIFFNYSLNLYSNFILNIDFFKSSETLISFNNIDIILNLINLKFNYFLLGLLLFCCCISFYLIRSRLYNNKPVVSKLVLLYRFKMSFFYNLLSIEDLIVDNNIDIDPEFIHPLILVSIYLCISFGLMFAFKMIKHYYAYQSFILENKNNYYFNKTLNDFKSSIFIDCYLYIYGGLFLLFFFFFQFFMLLIDCDCNEDSEFIFYSKFNNFYFIPETFIDEKDLSSKFNFISDYFVVKGDYSDDFKMFSTLSDKQISEMADRVVSVDIAKHRLLTFIESDLISSMEELSEVENLKSRFSNLYNLDPVEFNTNFINEYNKFLDFKRASVSSYKNFKTSFFSGKFSSSTFFNTDSGFNYLSNNKLENRFISDELPYFLYKSPYDITQAYGRYFYNKDIIYKGYAEAYADLYHLTIKAEIARLNYIDRLLLPEIKSELVNLNKFCIAHFHKASPLYIDNSYKSLEYIYDSFKDFNTKRLILTMEFAHVDYDLISYFYTGDGKYADRWFNLRCIYLYKKLGLL